MRSINKSVTFSFDDGVTQDIRLVEIMNRYGMKCTFNINSGIMNDSGSFTINGMKIERMKPDLLPQLYNGHEIAVHTLTHANLTELVDSSVKKEILTDKKNLEHFFNCEIIGMAYPYGSFSDKVIEIAKDCGIKYSRTVCDRLNFTMPENLMKLGASCHQGYDGIFDLIDDFIAYSGNEPAVLCIWGHSYEFDLDCSWDRFETICRKLSNRDDIFYGTNCEVYLQLGTE